MTTNLGLVLVDWMEGVLTALCWRAGVEKEAHLLLKEIPSVSLWSGSLNRLLESVLETGNSMRNSALAEVYSRSPPKLEGEILIVAELGLCILNDLMNNK